MTLSHHIQGLDLHDLCARFGTPLYIYDTSVIERQVENFRNAFSGMDIHLMYAVKSCTSLSIMNYMKTLGLGIDTVSVPEIRMGLELGFAPENIVFTPNIVEFSEIREAVSLGCSITVENLQNLEAFGREYNHRYPVCIRLNPGMIAEVDSKSATGLDFASINKEHYNDVSETRVAAWHSQSKFGISLTQFDQVLALVKKYRIRVNGIHLHSSHVILNRDVFIRGASIIFEIAKQFEHLEYVDFGGGIMVKHHPDDTVIKPGDLGPLFKKTYDEFCDSFGKKIQIWFEPGRYLISEAGSLVAKAVVLKTNGHIDFAGTNTGFNHLLRPMMYDAYHEIINVSNPKGELKTYNVVGNLCEIDNLGTQRQLNEVRKDDLILIKNAGAYGFSMSSNYNSRPKPAEVLVHKGEAMLIRKRDTYKDLVKNQIVVNF